MRTKIVIGLCVVVLIILIFLKLNANKVQREMQAVELVRVELDISLKAGGVHRCFVDVEEVNKNNLDLLISKITATDGSIVCYYSSLIGIIKASEIKNIYLSRAEN